jgi:hypothetical protein
LAEGLHALRTLISRDLLEELLADSSKTRSDDFLDKVLEVVKPNKKAKAFLKNHILGLLQGGRAGPSSALYRANTRIEADRLERVLTVPDLVVPGGFICAPQTTDPIYDDDLCRVVTPHTRHKWIESANMPGVSPPEIRQFGLIIQRGL